MTNLSRPNILFILSDQHAAHYTSLNSHCPVHTPNLEQLAADGVRFSNVYCQNPLCVPSRSSLISGRYSKDIGIYENRHILESNSLTFPRLLGQAGYRTCLIGKAHANGEQFQGYQQRPYGDLYGQAHQPEYIRTGEEDDESGLGDILGNSGATAIPLPMTQTEICVSEAVKWLQYQAETGRQPFLLSVNFDKPHFPMRAPERYYQRYVGNMVLPDYPENYLDQAAVNFVRNSVDINGRSRLFDRDPDIFRQALAAYCACIEWIDDATGRILAALDYLELADNTIVIYASDHGEMAGEKGAWQKTLFFDQSAKVPLIVRWPGHYRQGSVADDIAGLIDIYPTLCAAAGIEVPDFCSGTDLTPVLKHGLALGRDAVFSESVALKQPEHSGCMIRTQQYKYCYYLDQDNELYDMKHDPGEWHNLVGDERYQQIEEELNARVVDFWQPQNQLKRYKQCPAMEREKHHYLYSNQFIKSDGTVIDAKP